MSALVVMVTAIVSHAVVARDAPDPSRLPEILDRLDRVARLYRDSALSFTCDETVTYFGRFDRRTDRFEYLYAFDDEKGLVDRRTPMGKGGKPDAADGEGVQHWGLSRAYSWVFVFQENLRDRYRFRIEREKKVLGRPAIAIGFDAVPPYEAGINEFNGVAWVDAESFQLLRVDAERATDESAEVSTDDPDAPEPYLAHERFVTEFGVLENGMRFPSKVTIHRSRIGEQGRPSYDGSRARPILRVEQQYRNYRFFGVRTTEEIRRAVVGE
jgi:hypothetical protein